MMDSPSSAKINCLGQYEQALHYHIAKRQIERRENIEDFGSSWAIGLLKKAISAEIIDPRPR
jgi:hypothetical protein